MDMTANVERKFVINSGQASMGGLIGLLIAIVISVAVLIPVTTDVVEDVNATGTLATVLDIVPLIVGLIPIVLVARTIM